VLDRCALPDEPFLGCQLRVRGVAATGYSRDLQSMTLTHVPALERSGNGAGGLATSTFLLLGARAAVASLEKDEDSA
jgi:hypothetical protein